MSKGVGIGRKQKRDVDWGETVACHAGYYKFSHKHIKPTHTGNLLIDAHNMTHLSGFPNFPNSDRTPLFFHRPTHPTETTLGVLLPLVVAESKSFFDDVKKELECSVCRELFSEVNEPKILKMSPHFL